MGVTHMLCPKISIVTVTLNSDKTLERTIQSIVNQNYDNLEYIVVDGGSTDNTLEIIKKYETYIDHWISESDRGISDAFNKGIRMSSGKIIGIINSDDGLCDGALNALVREYEADVDVYRGNVLLWNTKTGTKVEEIPAMHFSLTGIHVNISHQGTFISKDAYEKYGLYDTNLKYAMDYELLIRFEKNNAKMKYINYLMAFYTLGGVTATPYSAERMHERDNIVISHGGTMWHLVLYRIVRYTKILLKKIISKDTILKMKHKKVMMSNTESL